MKLSTNLSTKMLTSYEITMCCVQSAIERSFKLITYSQWEDLWAGSPDKSTKCILKELLQEVIRLLTKCILEMLKNKRSVSQKQVMSTLRQSVPQSFAEVLCSSEKVQCKIAENFNQLIAKEVTESVNSAVSAGKETAEPVKRRMDTLLRQTIKFLNYLSGPLTTICKVRKKKDYVVTGLTTSESETTSVENISDDDGGKRRCEKKTNAIQEAYCKENTCDDIGEVVLPQLNEKSPQNLEPSKISSAACKPKITGDSEVKELKNPTKDSSADDRVSQQMLKAEDERLKTAVEVLAGNLIKRLFCKMEMKCDKEFCQSLKRLLFVKFWAEVEGKNLNITPEKIINLEKKIYEALHKDVRLTPALLLTLTTKGQALFEGVLSFYFKKYLFPKKKPSIFKRFFSTIRKAIFSCFLPNSDP